MAILSNINGKFAVDSTGAIQLSGSAGTANYVLVSGGAAAAPTWVAGSTVIGGPYLPLSGGTLTGNLSLTDGSNPSLTVTTGATVLGGTLNVTGDGTFVENVYLADDKALILGNAPDSKIFFDNAASVLADSTVIQSTPTGGTGTILLQSYNVKMRDQLGTHNMFHATRYGTILYYDGNVKLETTNTGVTVTGIITATGGNSTEWNTAYDDSIVSLAVAGTTTKTLTATQQDGGTLTASWTDNDGGGTVTGTGTATQVAFWSAGSAISSDADLYWDNTNKRLGIGTITPLTALAFGGFGSIWVNNDATNPFGMDTVGGELRIFTGAGAASYQMKFGKYDGTTFTTHMVIGDDGSNPSYVGIGTTSPASKLHILTNTSDATPQLLIQNGSTGDAAIKFNISGDTYFIGIDNSDSDKFKISYGAFYAAGDILTLDTSRNATFAGTVEGTTARFDTLNNKANSANIIYRSGTNTIVGNNADALVVQDGGNVGIGTTGPNNLLQVGSITNSTYVGPTDWNQVARFTSTNRKTSIVIQASGSGTTTSTQGLPAIEFDPYAVDGSGRIKTAIVAIDNYYGYRKTDLAFVLDSANDLNPWGIADTKMIIKNNGNVGIGTSSPGYKLDVNGNIRSSTVTVYDGMGGSETGIGASAAGGYLRLYTAGVNRVTVQSTNETMALYGNTTTGSNYMSFKNSAGTQQGYLGYGSSGTNTLYLVQQSSDDIAFYNGGATRMTINTTGQAEFFYQLKFKNAWNSGALYGNSFYVQDATDGFAMGVGTGISSWFSWSNTAGQKRAIDLDNDGNYILVGAGDQDVQINGTTSPLAPLSVDNNAIRMGRDWAIANRAIIRMDSNGPSYPTDLLYGHTAAANQSSWNGVYWSLSSRGSGADGKFYFYRGAGQDSPYNGEAVIMTFTRDLKVGINDQTPSYALDVTGDIRATADVIAYSDARVKDNIKTIDNALEKTTKLRGVSYTRKDIEDKSTKIGVIAQEVLEVLPEVVSKDDEGKYSVSYGNIVGVLIEAIKELEARVKELENK